MSGATITAVGKSVGLTTTRSDRSGLTPVTAGLTTIDTPTLGEVGPRARIDTAIEQDRWHDPPSWRFRALQKFRQMTSCSIALSSDRSATNEVAIVRLVGAILLEQNDEWAVQRARYMTPQTMARLSNDLIVGLPAVAT